MYDGSVGAPPGGQAAGGGLTARRAGLLVASALVVIAIAYVLWAMVISPFTWGEDGELALTIALDEATMPLDGSARCRYTITNVGATDLRILPPRDLVLSLRGPDNRTVQYTGAVPMLLPYEDDDLVMLEPGEAWSMVITISAQNWDLRAGETYGVRAVYEMGEQTEVRLPYWQGEVWSDTVLLSVG